MTKPIAMCRVSDVEPLMSIIPMLQGAGYDLVMPNRALRDEVRKLGGGNVDEIADMVRCWGAEPFDGLPEVGPEFMSRADLYVDVCPRNCLLVAEKWPNLRGKGLGYFINGGEPRNVPDKGDCQTPCVPLMTTAQHYRSTLFCGNVHWNKEAFSCDDPPNPRGYWTNHSLSHPSMTDCRGQSLTLSTRSHEVTQEMLAQQGMSWDCPHGCGPLVRAPWLGKVYVFYPAFTRWDRLLPRVSGSEQIMMSNDLINYRPGAYKEPVSFVHNSMSWGGQAWYPWAKKFGVKSYGGGNSPDGLIKHPDCFPILSSALCTVYLKSGGAVDYSILEPMATGCPTTFHESYRHNCRLYDLLEPEVTCLTWKDEHEMARCIERLRDPSFNRKIGEAGRRRMEEVCWSVKRDSDVNGFNEFMRKTFPL